MQRAPLTFTAAPAVNVGNRRGR